MSERFVIEIDWESLGTGSPEDRATFGSIGIRLGNTWLTEAHDSFVRRVREKVYLSGYQLAYWLAWNCWRLENEPKRDSLAWKMAHRLPTIGGGYVWPNVEFLSDGKFVLVSSKPSKPVATDPLRYISNTHDIVSLAEFRSSVSRFIEIVLDQLRAKGLDSSPLKETWEDICDERADAQSTLYRRIEAALGFDPEEAPQESTEKIIAEASSLGEEGIGELCAGTIPGHPVPEAGALFGVANAEGQDVHITDIPTLSEDNFASLPQDAPAWVIGQFAARTLRQQEQLGEGVLGNEKLCELAGTQDAALTSSVNFTEFSFALRDANDGARIVLAKKGETGRRFALARMLGDKLLQGFAEPLVPIMESRTYRQKTQRSFAAEFLCPFNQALDKLNGDFSDENQDAVASAFKVSPLLVRTQLVNNGHIERESLENF